MIKFIGFTIFFLIYFITAAIVNQRRNKKQYGLSKAITEQYQQLKVAPAQIEIITREYNEEVESRQSARVQALDSLYDNNRNFTTETKYASALVYHFLYKGKNLRLNSETIDMDPGSLKSLVKAQPVIIIYYDNKDINNYYFDLSFLAS